ncbi:hypothetical protein C2S52_008713 [Perilla frutescens var. hirtella]|uniref:FLZ-type domain-containing protein n=1 Tax=Perilla frutescens var. hirtella TaxID=608512 RepID=A0AAD4PE20_PERFH|nr:hypothetical protein C2S52_008713 [Perilla frutescens var. hirtella]KAH6835871.1 hypothetical protein C2S53_012553 [Perilla frutescens var. hirtella]
MLRKRSRSHQKDQNMNNLNPESMSESYISNQKHKNNSFLKVPGLFVGFNPRNSDSDSVRSPTSPLDFRIFSGLGNPFRCVRAQNEGHQKSWDCSKVGLSIIDSLDGGEANQTGTVARSSDNKNILFGRQMSVRSPTFCSHASSLEAPKSLPKNVAIFPNTLANPGNARRSDSDVVFEIGEAPFEMELYGSIRARSVDSGRCGSHLTDFGNRKSRLGSGNFAREPGRSGSGSGITIDRSPKLDSWSGDKLSSIPPSIPSGNGNGFIPPIPASEIELSEDYTCVRTHGPNPKVTHIFGDCILECHNDDLTDVLKKSESDDVVAYPSEDFLKCCYSCQKKLDGEDIYMYRGEKAFCSSSCRAQEIEMEEEDSSEASSNSSSLFV